LLGLSIETGRVSFSGGGGRATLSLVFFHEMWEGNIQHLKGKVPCGRSLGERL